MLDSELETFKGLHSIFGRRVSARRVGTGDRSSINDGEVIKGMRRSYVVGTLSALILSMTFKMISPSVVSGPLSDRIVRVKSLGEFRHRLLHGRMEDAVRIDAGGNELVVQFAGHREHQAVLKDGVLRRSGKFSEVATP